MSGENSKSNESKRTKQPSQCRVCHSPATYSYFGVISCEACKVFFRRNAQHEQNRLKCAYIGQCDISINHRPMCTSCRLAKCFKEGMRSEMIRRPKINKKINTNSNTLVKSNQLDKISVINLLDKDNSSLDDSQWILLSNLVQNYQEGQLFSISETIKHESDSLGILNPSTVQNLLKSFYEIAGNSLRSNVDIARLESNDRSVLLHTAANNTTCIGAMMTLYHSQLIHYPLLWKYLEDIYGKITTNYYRWSTQFTEPDMILCKLSMNLFALLTNTRMLCRNVEREYQNVKQILSIQDKYAEVIWKYLLYKYGYDDSIKRYVHMIKWFLTLTEFMQYVYSVDAHVKDVESLIEETEMALILDDVDKITESDIELSK